MSYRIFGALLVISLFSGCLKGNEEICRYDPCEFKAPAAEIQAVQDYLASAGINAIQHCSGMYYNVESLGTGQRPEICDAITVTYKGMLTNGNVFDQKTSPYPFNLGTLISSWKAGLSLIGEGGKITLYAPPSLAYGAREIRDANGNVIIPANSILVFEIGLVDVQ